ncbi:DNA cross-link repair 1A protein [Dinochytrium kinnereticum]|nr:DNA cross-link repair 1A protein [Dinochytrium kinnereticum]
MDAAGSDGDFTQRPFTSPRTPTVAREMTGKRQRSPSHCYEQEEEEEKEEEGCLKKKQRQSLHAGVSSVPDDEAMNEARLCPICSKDLSCFDIPASEFHVNRCLDSPESSDPQPTQNDIAGEPRTFLSSSNEPETGYSEAEDNDDGPSRVASNEDLDDHDDEDEVFTTFPLLNQSDFALISTLVSPGGSSSNALQIEGKKQKRRGVQKEKRVDRPKRACPWYKWIPGTKFTVDAFMYGKIEGCGLTSKFEHGPIYCSQVTANLVTQQLRVKSDFIHPLPMDTRIEISGVGVTLIDANHCPGAALILFDNPTHGQKHLHTGDFRFDPKIHLTHPSITSVPLFTSIYLDTTYCNPSYVFPPQQHVIQAVCDLVKGVCLHGRSVAEVVGGGWDSGGAKWKQGVGGDPTEATVHVIPLGKINLDNLTAHLAAHSINHDRIIGIRPTGWTFRAPKTQSNEPFGVTSLRPTFPNSKVTIVGVPYSEHSSFEELKGFVRGVPAGKVIPTVNVGKAEELGRVIEGWKRER